MACRFNPEAILKIYDSMQHTDKPLLITAKLLGITVGDVRDALDMRYASRAAEAGLLADAAEKYGNDKG